MFCKPKENGDDSGFLCDILLLGPGHFVLLSSGKWLRMKAGAGGWDTQDGKWQLLLSSLSLQKVPAPSLDNCVWLSEKYVLYQAEICLSNASLFRL